LGIAKAQDLIARGELDEAERAVLPVDAHDPRRALVMANIYAARGEAERALGELDKARDLHPEHAPVHLRFAIQGYDMDQYAEASAALSRVLELQPKNELAWSYMALCHFALKQDVQAQEIFSTHGFSDNRDFMVRLTIWIEEQWLHHDRFFAQRSLNDSIFDSSKATRTRVSGRKAEKLFFAKKFPEMLRELAPELEKADSGEEELFASALACEMMCDYQRALQFLARLRNESEENDSVRAAHARCELRLRHFDLAADQLGQVLIIGPEDYAINYYLGVLCLAYNERERAKGLFRRAYTDYLIDTLEYQFWQIQHAALEGLKPTEPA
jgi:predicted Zn-dependent protease